MLRGKDSNQTRAQDQHCVSVSSHGSNLTENGKHMPTQVHAQVQIVAKIIVIDLYSLPLIQGPHLPTTVVDVRLQPPHTPLIIAPPTLQRLHLPLHLHFSSSNLFSSAICNYLHTANQQRDFSAQKDMQEKVQPMG